MKKQYHLKGLDCPNCAAKIEKEVSELSCVREAKINLMNQTLSVDTKGEAGVLAEVTAIVKSHEPHVEVTEADSSDNRHGHDHHDHDHSHEENGILPRLILGGALFALSFVLSHIPGSNKYISVALTLVAYLILGCDVLFSAVRNIIRGRVFDENFLMTVASIGAIALGEYTEASAVMLFYQIGEYFQSRAVESSRRSVKAILDIRPDTAYIYKDGELQQVSPEDVRVGDVITVRPGDRVPLDGVVTSGKSSVDKSALTGESVPQSVNVGDKVFSGCINGDGVLTVRVTETFGGSTASKIIDMVENAASRKSRSENFITSFARYYTPAVVIFALILGIVPSVITGEWSEWIRRALVFLVISCPCALVISVPLAFFGGIGAASVHGVLVKGGNYLEALNRVKTVVFDKTGTLTHGVFQVSEVLGIGDNTPEEVLFFAAVAEQESNHPIARSIIASNKNGGVLPPLTSCREVSGKGIIAEADGRKIAVGNISLMRSEGIAANGTQSRGTQVYVAVDGVNVGAVTISDKVKDSSSEALKMLKRLGVLRTVMLTGDTADTAEAVAEQLQIDEFHADLLPGDKLTWLDEIMKDGGGTAFIGDGINDSPAIARADVGVAMGALGSDAAIEAADIVLMNDDLLSFAEALRIAKATRSIVTQNIAFSLGVKLVFLILGALGCAGMWSAVFADVGVALIAVMNSLRILRK